MKSGRWQLDHDWYAGGIPGNIELESDVYLDSSYGFAPFLSKQQPGLTLGKASGAYDRATFLVGPNGKVRVGQFTCLNGTFLICNSEITIGAHCLLSWGVVITDSPPGMDVSVATRHAALDRVASDPDRWLPPLGTVHPVRIEDNVWVGFDSVVLPGVTLGHGCVVGCKSVVSENIPPYAVVVGNPARVVRGLDPDDSPAERAAILEEFFSAVD
jgi:acetyltransferase-like isoleucine patch superfamily enzyme